jgi:hypothetical protein
MSEVARKGFFIRRTKEKSEGDVIDGRRLHLIPIEMLDLLYAILYLFKPYSIWHRENIINLVVHQEIKQNWNFRKSIHRTYKDN